MDLSLDGESRQSVSIVALGIDSSKSFKSKYGDDLYSIERVKLAYYPSLEVIEVSIYEYTNFCKSIGFNSMYVDSSLYENSRLNIVSGYKKYYDTLYDKCICKTILPKISNREYFICYKDKENKLYELCACIYDIKSGDYLYKIGAPAFVFNDNRCVALYFDFISNKLEFMYRKVAIFMTLNTQK